MFFVINLFLLLGHEGFSQSPGTGKASFYNDKFEGKLTASGQVFSQSKLTAAHRTLPFKTKIKVTNEENKNTVVVTINDRGPYIEGRVLDLSKAAAKKLKFIDKGVVKVTWKVVK